MKRTIGEKEDFFREDNIQNKFPSDSFRVNHRTQFRFTEIINLGDREQRIEEIK